MKSKILISIKYKEATGVGKGKGVYGKYINEVNKGTPPPDKIPSNISGAKNLINTDYLWLFNSFKDFRSLVLDSN